jgi:hypothetical protein
VTGLGVLALALMVAHAPVQWRWIARVHHLERLRSTPGYAMGLKATRAAALSEGSRLYFAGIELPTLVYYAAMPVEFIRPAGGLEQITDPGTEEPPRLDADDLALVDPRGDLVPIANLVREWEIVGPGADSSGSR